MDQEESLQIDAGILHYVHNRSLILRSIFGLLLCQKEMLNQFHRYEVSSHTMMLLRNVIIEMALILPPELATERIR